MQISAQRSSALALCAGLLAATSLGCGGAPAGSAETIAVQVQPPSAILLPSMKQAFTAAVTGTAQAAVKWSVQESAGGTVDAAGNYTAPSSEGTFHVVATSVADPTRSAVAVVNVSAAALGATVLPADRRTIWNPGLNAVGGIPVRTTVFKTISPSGGDDTATIQAALDACPPNQVVQLTAGTFNITGNGLTLRNSYVTLRGAGPSLTKLVKPAGTGYPVIIIGQRWYKRMQPVDLTADAVKGAYSVTITSDPGLAVGEIVHVDETYDPALTYFNPATQTTDYLGWGEGKTGPMAASRPIGQAMEIASISGNTVTFTTPFHMTFRTSHAAHLVRLGDGTRIVPSTKWSGIEQLYVANGEGGDGGGNIRLFAAAYCWGANIESDQSLGASFAFDGTFRCVLRDSYLHSTRNPTPGGSGYGIVLDSYAADNLVENDISWNFNKVMAMRSSGGGNVMGYNYMEDGYGANYPTFPEVGLNASHMTTPHMELFEGNQSFNFDSDSYWGNSIYVTVFRNNLTSLRRSLPGVTVPLVDSTNRRAVGLTDHIWWYSFIGNVLGYPDGYDSAPVIGDGYPATFSPEVQGTTFRYEWLGGAFGSSGGYTPMWQLGYNGQHWYTTPDASTVSTTLRDGNYDFATNSVRWHGIGGTGAGTTPNPIPTIPPSLYLRSKPAFFGANPWPWVDPLGATKLYTLPARARFDAGTPNG